MEKPSPSQRLNAAIQILRSSIARERTLYVEMQRVLEKDFPDAWAEVSNGIKAIAIYYNGEIARAKNDLADWMNGHDVGGTYADAPIIKDLHEYIDSVKEMAISNDEEIDAPVEIIKTLAKELEGK